MFQVLCSGPERGGEREKGRGPRDKSKSEESCRRHGYGPVLGSQHPAASVPMATLPAMWAKWVRFACSILPTMSANRTACQAVSHCHETAQIRTSATRRNEANITSLLGENPGRRKLGRIMTPACEVIEPFCLGQAGDLMGLRQGQRAHRNKFFELGQFTFGWSLGAG
jgi:hypothetical protein